MGVVQRFTTKTRFNWLKRQVLAAALLILAVKLLVTAPGAPPDGSWLDLLARVPPNVVGAGQPAVPGCRPPASAAPGC